MVSKVGIDHEKVLRFSWYTVGQYVERFSYQSEVRNEQEELNWARTRILWSIIWNTNYKKKVKPQDLIKLSFDDRVPKYHEIDIGAMKKRFGSKINKKRGK